MKLLRLVLVIFAVLLVSGTLAAQDNMVTLTWWVETTNQDQLDYLQVSLVAPFEEAHPGIHLEITGQEQMQDVLRTAILGGTAPDVLATFGPSWNAEYIASGFMESLDAYAEQYGWKDKLLPWAYATGTVEGTLYSIPLTYESVIMFYDKTLFDENGWTVPTNRAELETVANAALDMGIHPFSYGNRDAVWSNGHIITGYLNN
ncbi:MAG: extracellular solute-binding protein, partial [Anaerolineae bacterium]|nr:extracellular solute-binding protein [Anaerolineae bacterium]